MALADSPADDFSIDGEPWMRRSPSVGIALLCLFVVSGDACRSSTQGSDAGSDEDGSGDAIPDTGLAEGGGQDGSGTGVGGAGGAASRTLSRSAPGTVSL